ncbi:MAG: sulfotransferase [Bacteroidota bacterium]
MSKLADAPPCRPFFIVGAHRSGTTMLQLMLDQHSQVAVCPETILFKSLQSVLVKDQITANWQYQQIAKDLLRRREIFQDPARDVVLEYYNTHPTYAGPVKKLLQQWGHDYLKRKKKQLLGEKTPNHAYYLPAISTLLPNARVILLYRHPLDVICSLTQALLKSDARAGVSLRSAQFEAAALVRRALEGMRKFKQAAVLDYIELEYAVLVTQPEKTIKALCAFLDIEYETQMLQFQAADLMQDSFTELKKAHAKLQSEVTNQSVGRYRKELDLTTSTALRRFLATELQHLEYDFSDPLVPLSLKQSCYLYWQKLHYALGLHQWQEWRFRQKSRLRLFWSYLSFGLQR